MDAVGSKAPKEQPGEFQAALTGFEEAVSSLRDSADLARLTDDPAAPSLEALVRVMTATSRQFHLRDRERKEIGAALEARARQIADDATRRVEASGAAIVSKLAPDLAKLVERTVRQRLWTIRARTILISAGLGVALVLGAGSAAYFFAYKAGRTEGLEEARVIDTAMKAGPNAAGAWSQIMAFNDPVAALQLCRKSAGAEATGRRFCALPIWLDAPPPPAPKTKTGS
jgi:hypothetical protein